MEQMLEQLSESDRAVLVEWSILRHLNGRLCDRVTDRMDSATHLAQLSEANLLLMPLDANADWYRLHDLLRDALLREFARLPAEQQRVAHLRATEWWLENGDIPQAIDHAMEAGDHEHAAELLCASWLEYMLSGLLQTLRDWIAGFPTEAMLAYPPVLVTSAWVAAFSGDVEATHRFAAAAREASFDLPMPDGSTSYTSAVAILRAGLGLDGMKNANEDAELAYRLEAPEGPWRQLAAALAGVTRFGLGRNEGARVALNEAARMPAGPDGTAVYARGQLALLEMSAGHWEEGSRQADIACAQIEESELQNLLSSGAALVAAAAAAAHFGNRGSALQRLRSLASIQQVLSDSIPFDAFQINLIAAETYLLLGNHRAASVHARTASSRLGAFGDAGIFEDRLIEVQKALASDGEGADAPGSEPELLSDRELQILAMLPSDLSLRDIGSRLYVSRNTAKSHVSSVYRKLGVTSRTAAIARARQLDLI
jgi:LuxR family maltose regulon positive regulatory protein